MKISESQAASNTSQARDSETDSKKRGPDEAEKSSFSKVLSNKRSPGEGGSSHGGKPFAGELDPSMMGTMQLQTPFEQTMRPAPVQGAQSVNVPPDLQQLVKEISVVVNSPDHQQVHIELNSNVLKGLHVDIRRQDGAVSIEFRSNSDQVSNLISSNLSVLSQNLQDSGVNVSNIRVSGARDLARTQDFKGQQPRGGQGRQRGGR